ncbi:MAG: D-alanine--D-alanine ligase [Alphaproteobacteria bacterium]|nr:D-alanine--D-alanine ligase [Alphaproteobacteria bacterium]
MTRQKLGLFFGGKSTEHEISILSAVNVIENLNRDKYELLLIYIDKQGKFHFGTDCIQRLPIESQNSVCQAINRLNICKSFPHELSDALSKYIDVAFPVLHGYLGEDGSIQGLLNTLNIPFVGAGVLGSSICMDKDITKKILRSDNIAVADSITIKKNDVVDYRIVKKTLGDVLFVKPANLGSSVGVRKAHNESEFFQAISEAFKFDNKLLIEKAIEGREIECGVIGNENPQASKVCGEIFIKNGFYSYEAKYLDDTAAVLTIPADISEATLQEIRSTAVRAFKAVGCEGMARIDFFLTKDNQVILNEINTIPGFTSISMFPAVWLHSGVRYQELIDQLIDLATERFNRNSTLITKRQ